MHLTKLYKNLNHSHPMFPKLAFIYLFISNRLPIRERSLMAGNKFHYYINIHDGAIFWKNRVSAMEKLARNCQRHTFCIPYT